MAWGVHKPSDCRVSQNQKESRAPTKTSYQVAARAVLATIMNPQWSALVANITRNMANE